MPKEYHYSFKVTREDGTIKLPSGEFLYPGPTSEDEHFMALIRCLATYPSKFASLKDDEIIKFIDERNVDSVTRKPKTFLIGWL